MSEEVRLLETETLGIWDILFDAISIKGEESAYASFDSFLTVDGKH